MTDKNMIMAGVIAEKVARAGGRTFFVGGMVRDRLCGRETKDIDIEVHGILPETLRAILEEVGTPASMGASFGILGLLHYDIDIAMPRKETATGRGHKDFEVYVDPFLGPEKAAFRRDFTMNALMEDVLTGEVLDFFGGREDLKRGILRHVNDKTFAEDPLRVLRGAQFAARFGFEIANETVALAKTMDLRALPKERIFGELEKAFLKADRPSVFFEQMRRMDQLDDWFPEVKALIGAPQNPASHPEGDVWTHTMMVLDTAAGFREKTKDPAAFLTAALAHDFGKGILPDPAGEETGDHALTGMKAAGRFVRRISAKTHLYQYTVNMTRLHMKPNRAFRKQSPPGVTARIFDESTDPAELLLLAKADWLGRKNPSPYDEAERFLLERLKQYQLLMEKPRVQGRDLLEAGILPGPVYRKALDYAHELQLDGAEKEEALRKTLIRIAEDKESETDR